MKTIAIIDYGMGNLRSVQKALERVGGRTVITEDGAVIKKADKVVLPGVGAMKPAIQKLEKLGLVKVIKESVAANKPFLGICLGFQLLFEEGNEGGKIKGLGILKGKVDRFKSVKVPHMGWNQLKIKNKKCPLIAGIKDNDDVYFCHSYFATPKDKSVILTTTKYGKDYVSSIAKDNLFGVQFHPEKSQNIGLKILENFVRL
jgi:glutamine amidotransferase